jgi:hypothetical protein
MQNAFDAWTRDVAAGALSRRQVLRRIGTGAGLALIALTTGGRGHAVWAAGAPCNGTVCGADCCTTEERCTNGRCTPINGTCNGPGETKCGPDCCTPNEVCTPSGCKPR